MTELERDYQKAVRVIKGSNNYKQPDACLSFINLFNRKHDHIGYYKGLLQIFFDHFYSGIKIEPKYQPLYYEVLVG